MLAIFTHYSKLRNRRYEDAMTKKKGSTSGLRARERKMLEKLVELLDGITIDPFRGVILTPKKKRQVAELQKMGQKQTRST